VTFSNTVNHLFELHQSVG